MPEHARHQVRVECDVDAWCDRNRRFHSYEPLAPTHRVADLLTEVDRDPTGIFRG